MAATITLDAYLNTAEVTDGSSFNTDDPSQILPVIEAAESELTAARKTSENLSKMLKRVAYNLTMLCMMVRDRDGYPILSYEGKIATQTMLQVLDVITSKAFPIPADATSDVKRELQAQKTKNLASVRLYRTRLFIEWAIVGYVLENHNFSTEQKAQLSKPGFLKWGTVDRDYPDVVLLQTVPVFMHEPCAEIYKRSGLIVPEKFGGPAKGTGSGSGPGKDKKFVPEDWKNESVIAVSHVTPLHAAQAILALVNVTVAQILQTTDISDRPEVAKTFLQIKDRVFLAAKHLDGKITETEADKLQDMVTPDLMAALKAEIEKNATASEETEPATEPEPVTA